MQTENAKPQILGVDWADPNGDRPVTVKVTVSPEMLAENKVEVPADFGPGFSPGSGPTADQPLAPAPPTGANMTKLTLAEMEAQEKEKLAAIQREIRLRATIKPLEFSLLTINGFSVDQSQGAGFIASEMDIPLYVAPKVEEKPKLPPGDLTKRIILDTRKLKGKMGRKMGRIQLKGVRKEQMRHLKEIGYFKQKPDVPPPPDFGPTVVNGNTSSSQFLPQNLPTR